MSAFGDTFLHEGDPNLVGEYLRSLTFVGEGYGCYSTFDVRSDARKWTVAERNEYWAASGDNDDGEEEERFWPANLGEGYTFETGGYRVDVCWYWDGDGVLTFVVRRGEELVRCLYNSDCKKDHYWRDDQHEAVVA